MLFNQVRVVVRGGGDLASGVVYRLHRAGFPVVVLELPEPLLVRRAVSFGEAVYSAKVTVEGIHGQCVSDVSDVDVLLTSGIIPVLADSDGRQMRRLYPKVVIDARMEKRNINTTINDAPIVIALGPGFAAGIDCHAVIETNRGHNLGRVYWQGSAEPDTGQPGGVQGRTHSRVLRAPAAGYVTAKAAIGDMIQTGQVIATVAGIPVTAPFDGMLRGLIHEQVYVTSGLKIGDLDPRAQRENCFRISDKALAVGGGVLEAILTAVQRYPYLIGE